MRLRRAQRQAFDEGDAAVTFEDLFLLPAAVLIDANFLLGHSAAFALLPREFICIPLADKKREGPGRCGSARGLFQQFFEKCNELLFIRV